MLRITPCNVLSSITEFDWFFCAFGRAGIFLTTHIAGSVKLSDWSVFRNCDTLGFKISASHCSFCTPSKLWVLENCHSQFYELYNGDFAVAYNGDWKFQVFWALNVVQPLYFPITKSHVNVNASHMSHNHRLVILFRWILISILSASSPIVYANNERVFTSREVRLYALFGMFSFESFEFAGVRSLNTCNFIQVHNVYIKTKTRAFTPFQGKLPFTASNIPSNFR